MLAAGTVSCFGLGACGASHATNSAVVAPPPSSQMPPAPAPRVLPAPKIEPSLVAKTDVDIDEAVKHPPLPCQLQIGDDGTSLVLEFHAESSSVPRIRDQARELERYLNQNRDAPPADNPDSEPAPDSFAVRRILTARPLARMENLPDGARLTLTPDDPARRDELRAQVLWYAADLLPGLPLAGKTCPELPAELAAQPAISAQR